jgi:hypothetical protein
VTRRSWWVIPAGSTCVETQAQETTKNLMVFIVSFFVAFVVGFEDRVRSRYRIR